MARRFLWGLILVLAAGPAHAGDWAEEPPGTADPEALRELADSQEDLDGNGIIMLLHEDVVRIDEQGREDVTRRLVYQLRTPAAVSAWGHVKRCWSPWNQDRPVVTARVMAEDGQVYALDPTTLLEADDVRGSQEIYEDRKCLEGPLPNVAPGALVEEVAHITQHRAVFGTWSDEVFTVDRSRNHTPRRRILIQAAPGVELAYATVGGDVPLSFKRSRRGTTLRLDVTDLVPIADWELELPLDRPTGRWLAISTAPSWNTLAKSYGERVASKIDAAGLEDLVAQVQAAPDRSEALRIALRGVQERIRYTGLELGEQALIPFLPSESVARGFGDCKDQATALVAVLRASEIPAHLALLQASMDPNAPDDLPRMGRFNHAIVYVPGDTPLWIDPTDRTAPVGELPRADSGRRALVIRPDTRGLVTTPWAQGTTRELVTVDASSGGASDLVDRAEHTGWMVGPIRSWGASAGDERWTNWAESHLESQYSATYDQHLVKGLAPDDPVAVREFRGTASSAGNVALTNGWLTPSFGDAFNGVPLPGIEALQEGIDAQIEGSAAAGLRVSSFHHERVIRWDLPPGWGAASLPDGYAIELPGLSCTALWESGPAWIQVTLVNASPGGSLALSDAKTLAQEIDRIEAEQLPWSIQVSPEALRLAREDPVRAVAAARAVLAEHPDDPMAAAGLSVVLAELGFGQAARDAVADALVRWPDEPVLWRAELVATQLDAHGRSGLQPYDRDAGVAATRAFLALEPEDTVMVGVLVDLLRRDADGYPGADEASLQEALGLLEEHLERVPDDVALRALRLHVLGDLGEWEALRTSSIDHLTDADALGAWVAGNAMLGERALTNAIGRFSGGDRFKVGSAAQKVLLKQREYVAQGHVVAATAETTVDPQAERRRADFLRGMQHWEDVTRPGTPERGLVDYVLAVHDADALAQAVELSRWERSAADQAIEDMVEPLADFSDDFTADVFLAYDLVDVTPRVRRAEERESTHPNLTWIIKRGRTWRVLGTSAWTPGLGLELLAALDKRDLDLARLWAGEIIDAEATRSGGPARFSSLVVPDPATADADRLRALGAVTAAVARPEQLIDDQEALLSPLPEDVRQVVFMMAGQILESATLYDLSARWWQGWPLIQDLIAPQDVLRMKVLGARGDREALLALVDEVAADPGLFDQLVSLIGRVDLAAALTIVDERGHTPSRPVANNLAWALLLRDQGDDLARGHALLEQALSTTRDRTSAQQHTLACLAARQGDFAMAWSLYANQKSPLFTGWGYVRGLIAQELGLPAEARRAHESVDGDPADTRSTAWLSRQALDGMDLD